MAYYEGEISPIGCNSGYNNGFGFGGNRGGAGSEMLGYELGKVATTNDVASGFTTNTILGVQRDQTLATQQGFANVQQTLCQGFNGINTALLQGFHGVDNSVCTLGYQQSQLVNGLSRELADCWSFEILPFKATFSACNEAIFSFCI